ncbi:MAG: signal peptidase I, partial [Acidimicrobiia bacterium]|nr:signal peptidase I [Acidimicrobiia bacterium]
MAIPETRIVRRDGGVTGNWSPLLAYALSALYIWILLWLIVWVAVPTLVLRWEPVLITSDSMAPKVRSGDFVLLAETPANLDPGSVVTFTLNDHLVTHRIAVTNGDGTYITQGDANPLPDSTLLSYESIEGAPRLLVSTVGLPLLWYQRGEWVPFSIWVLVTMGAASYLVSESDRRRRRPEGDTGPDDRHVSPLGGVAAAALVAFALVGATVPSAAAFAATTDNSPDTFTASEWELFVGLVGGVGHSCGVNDEGVVWCWGLNDKGQLGDG